MHKNRFKNIILFALIIIIVFASGCKMRKKNRCNTCPKWSEESIQKNQQPNLTDA
jgi:murein L,D-transpeptidase YafK